MSIITFEELTQGSEWVGLGIAGNQAEHLDQAGEADDFKDVEAPENAPKGIFPWYIPGSNGFLATNPISHDKLNLKGQAPLQPEPEIALLARLHYSERSSELISHISVAGFTSFNDCSRRVNAKKISQKKNWGAASQGIGKTIMEIQDFTDPGGVIEDYRLTCYLEREGILIAYGKDTSVSDYCYFNQTLVDWIVHQINTQVDHGPLEPIQEMLVTNKPELAVIGIGATCYTEMGNSSEKFLKKGDKVYVVVYNADHYGQTEIESKLKTGDTPEGDASLLVLAQEVVEK